MRSATLTTLAAIAIAQLPQAAAAAKAATPLGTEILAFESALTEAALPGWAEQRATWVRLVSGPNSPQILATAVATLEQSMAWETVEPAWKGRREAWAAEAGRAATSAAVARLLLELEGHTRWSAVRETWKQDRDGWVRRVGALAAASGPSAPGSQAARTPSASGGSAGGGISAEMQSFLSGFDGDYKAVKAALAKHGAPGLDHQDMGIMNLADPRVTASEQKAGRQCYTFEATAGITVRTYAVCWQGGKIVSVEDRGMR